jgi:hypothetical protein
MFIYYSLGFTFSFLYLYTNDYIRDKINLSEKDYIQLVGKINSIIHATIVVVMSVLFLFDLIDSEIWIQCLEVTRGYCLYDTIMILCYTPKDRNMIIHHTMLFFGSYSNFISIYPEQSAFGLLAEITNQHLYFGWLLIKKGKDKTWYFNVNAVILLLMFLVFRVLNFTYLFIFAIQNCSYLEPLAILPILLLNYYWFSLLLHKALCSSVVISSGVIKNFILDYLKTLIS